MDLSSDNVVGATAEVLAAIVAANGGDAAPYGTDPHSRRAEDMLRDVFACDCAVYLVGSGTAANALALSTLVSPWQAILCHETSHILGEEAGAPEFFTGGAKVVGIAGAGGKLSSAALGDAVERHPRGVTRKMPPGASSLSQSSEYGTVYTPDEIVGLSALAHSAGLRTHMDGARFANALVALDCTPAEMTWRAGIDCLSFGATKNGALACEAVLFFDKTLAEAFEHRRKRGGHTLSKGRFLGVQMCAYLEDGRWLGWARHANAMARQLADGLIAHEGVRLIWPVEANAVFAALPFRLHKALAATGIAFGVRTDRSSREAAGIHEDEVFARFVTSHATDAAELQRILAYLPSK